MVLHFRRSVDCLPSETDICHTIHTHTHILFWRQLHGYSVGADIVLVSRYYYRRLSKRCFHWRATSYSLVDTDGVITRSRHILPFLYDANGMISHNLQPSKGNQCRCSYLPMYYYLHGCSRRSILHKSVKRSCCMLHWRYKTFRLNNYWRSHYLRLA